MANLAKTSYPLPELKFGARPFSEILREQYEAFDKLQEAASKVDIDKGEVVGLIHSIPWADGAAYYLVTKEKPLTLQHIPVGDAWQIPYTYIHGTRKYDILRQEAAERTMIAAFEKRKEENE